MKFICNNCGFSAEVPDTMNACPMCASQNVSSGEEKTDGKGRKAKDTGNFTEEQQKEPENIVENPVEPPKSPEKKKVEKAGKESEKITLNDQFFDSKPEKDQEELANIIKELYPETGKEGGGLKVSPKVIAIVASCLVAAALIAVVVFVIPSGKKEKGYDEPEKISEKTVEEKVASAVIEDEEDDFDDIEEEVEEKVAVAKEEPVKEEIPQQKAVAAKRQAGTPPAKRPAARTAQAPQPQRKAAPVTQPVKVAPAVKEEPPKPAPPPPDLFNNYLQAGHKAIAERRFADALNEYRNASKLRPSEGSVYKFIGITHAHMQNQKEACANYRRYIQLAPNAKDRAQVEALIEACP